MLSHSMKLLNVIFTYNRYFLLKNTVDSFREFGPPGDLLIIDDGSDDPLVRKYLSLLRSEGVGIIVRKWENKSAHGGLYANMNLAIESGLEGNYTHIFLLQDDLQFMWRDDHFLERVERFFSECTNASTLHPLLFKGIVKFQMSKHVIEHPELQAWQLLPFGIFDVGIMPLHLFKDPYRRFNLSTEKANSARWYDWGYRVYAPLVPTIARVPWPCGGMLRFGVAAVNKEPPNKYFLKPFDESQIKALKDGNIKILPYHEDFCKPWGWKCLSPYFYSGWRRHYIELILRGLFTKDVQFPRIVTVE